MARRRSRGVWLAALAVGLALPAQAHAFNPVLNDIIRDGQVSPCAHSEGQLRSALNDIPNDLAQYAPDIRGRIQAALNARARGACSKGGGGGAVQPTAVVPVTPQGPSAPTPSAPSPQRIVVRKPPEPPATPKPAVKENVDLRYVPVSSQAEPPPPLTALLLLAILGSLTALLLLAIRGLGIDIPGAARVRHAFGEAAYRLGDRFDRLRRT